MNVEDWIYIFEHYTTEFIAFITFAISILSNILSLVEYFRLKAKWDYYYLNDSGRGTFRHGFHPEYLSTSIFIVGTVIFISNSKEFREVINQPGRACGIILHFTLIIFIGAYTIFYFFSKANIKKGIYTKSEYSKAIAQKAFHTTVKYSILITLFYLMYKKIIGFKYGEIMPYLIIGGALAVFCEYYTSKIRTAQNRIYDIIKYNGKEYCVLSFTNSEKYYIVEAETNENEIKLYLNIRMLIDVNEIEIHTKSFKKTIGYFNDRIVNDRFFID